MSDDDDDYSMPDDDEPVNIDMIGEKNVVWSKSAAIFLSQLQINFKFFLRLINH